MAPSLPCSSYYRYRRSITTLPSRILIGRTQCFTCPPPQNQAATPARAQSGFRAGRRHRADWQGDGIIGLRYWGCKSIQGTIDMRLGCCTSSCHHRLLKYQGTTRTPTVLNLRSTTFIIRVFHREPILHPISPNPPVAPKENPSLANFRRRNASNDDGVDEEEVQRV